MARPVEVVKSPDDKKEYRRIDLENGLAILLIHDPEAAAALANPPPVRPAAIRLQPAVHLFVEMSLQ